MNLEELDKDVYRIDEVARLTGFKLRPLLEDCRARRVQHRALLKKLTVTVAAQPRTVADPDELDRVRASRRRRAA